MTNNAPHRVLSPSEIGDRLNGARMRAGLTKQALADGLGVLRQKLDEAFSGEMYPRINWLYLGPPKWVREVLVDVADMHELLVVQAHNGDEVAHAMRWIERLAGLCGTAVAEFARILADGRVDAAEGEILERIGHALVAEGESLIRLGRSARRDRVVRIPTKGRL